MQIDDAINKINSKFLFKILAFLVLSFPTYQNYGQMQGILLAIVTPNHTCQFDQILPNITISQDQCTININGSFQKCTKWNFSQDPVGKTMVSDYELVCDKKNLGDIILIIWYFSSFTAILMGWLSDKYGRKKITILSLSIETLSSILLAVAPNVESNMIFRFFLGVSASGIYIAFVWLLESVDIEFRRFIGSFFWAYGCLAYMVFPMIVYAIKNWRYTQLISIIPNCLYIFVFFIPESPRWLFVVGKRGKALKSMQKIANINKLKIDFDNCNIVITKEANKDDLWNALKSSVFLQRSIITFLLQFSTALLYSSVTVNISIISNNILLSIFLLGLMETPGLFLSFFCLKYLKRKFSIITFGMIGSILFWFGTFFNRDIYWQSIFVIVLGCIGKATVASVNQTTMVYAAELFPTSHRSFAFVCVQLAVFLSFVSAIFINKLNSIYIFLPMSIYVISMLLSCVLTFYLLPETMNLPYPETLEDQKRLRINKEHEFVNFMKSKKTNDNAYSNVVEDVI